MSSLLKYISRSLNYSMRTAAAEYFKTSTVCSVELPPKYSSDSLSETDQPKPKKRARKSTATKRKKSNTKAETIETETESTEVIQVQPAFPFEGVLPVNHHGDENLPPRNHDNVERIDSSSGVRHYVIKSSGGSYRFPSVTTVLEATQPADMYFRLLNWRKGLVKEHGESKSIDITQGIIQSGKDFHKVIEQTLLDSTKNDLISIKPHVRDQPLPTTLQRTTNTLRTYKPPAYRPIQSIPITTRNIKPLVNTEAFTLEDEVIEDIETEELAPSSDEDSTHVCVDGSMHEESTPDSDDATVEDSPQVLSASDGYMKSVEHVLRDIGSVCALESMVTHMELGYTGTFDCLAEYRGALSVIDWKTSSKPKPTLSDCFTYPLQAAAYAGAINQDPHYPSQVRNALIVVVYPNGDPCHAHFLSHDQLLSYWTEWLERLEHYQTQFSRDLSQLTLH